MPIYEYHCGSCSTDFELLVLGSEQPVCPTCQQVEIEKLISVPASPASSGQSLPVASPPDNHGMGGCCGGHC